MLHQPIHPPAADASTRHQRQRQSLQQHFGFSAFREGQQTVVDLLLQGQSCLAIFPTGAGKSLCYQFAATQLAHLTLVVSPLLALMKDQLAFLASKGIAAASIDSTLSPAENQQVMREVSSGQCKILMVSVERFKNERFRQFINNVPVSLLVIDESHCISEWGHNFRPDYLKLPSYQQQLAIPQVLLLTATATAKVKRDMAARFVMSPDNIVQTGFYRANLQLQIKAISEAEKPAALVELLRGQAGSTIVYVTLQQSAEQVAQLLQQRGLSAKAYHAGLGDELRQRIQQQFMANQVQIVVATIAFGMGIDKADVRQVVHYDLPKSIENYSQEIGRAGRDGKSSVCTVLANLDGLTTVENFVYGDTPEQAAIARVLEFIGQNLLETEDGSRWEVQLNELSNHSNIRQLPLKTLLVQLELAGVIQSLYSYFAEFKLRFISQPEQILALFEGERREFLAALLSLLDMKKVWGSLNFDSLQQHYAAPRQRVISALEYLAEQQHIELQSRLMTEVYAVDTLALQAPDLLAKLSAYFAGNESKEIKRIASLIRFFELDSCLSYQLARYFDDHQAPRQCGHCSVCQGHPVRLSRSVVNQMPHSSTIAEAMQQLAQHMAKHTDIELSTAFYSRFLTAISMPAFSRARVSKLSGFGLCAQLPYAEVRDAVQAILSAAN